MYISIHMIYLRKMPRFKVLAMTPTVGTSVVARLMYVQVAVDVVEMEAIALVPVAVEGGVSILQQGSILPGSKRKKSVMNTFIL
jgi:hypothetical protein